MTPFIHALLHNSFLQMAFWASVLASISSGIIGSYVVVRRIASIAGCISHTVLGGMGVSLWLQRVWHIEWMHPMLGAFVAAILSALLLGWIQLKFRQREDALIATIWSTGMAIGVIFISLTPGSTSELMNFLFGNILWVSLPDLLALAALDVVVLVLAFTYYRPLLALCFDEEQAKLQKVPVQALYFLLLCLIALSIVLLIQIIGTVLVLALLTIPATISSLLCHRLGPMMAFACLLSIIFSWVGLELAYDFNWPPGATIALTAAASYALILIFKNRILSQKKSA
jgi:zinc transport system permease protein